MLGNLKEFLLSIFANFGPILVFWGGNHFGGLRIAILASIAYTMAEIIYSKINRKPITLFFKFSAITSLLFGCMDLYLNQSTFIHYEAVLTNVFTGVFFAFGAFAPKPLIQEFAEKTKRKSQYDSADMKLFFKLLTLVWSAYFFLKAGFYTRVALQPIRVEEKLALRSSVGGISLVIMLSISILGGRRLFHLFKKVWPQPTQFIEQ